MENKPTIKTNEGLAELKHVLKNNESGYFGDSLIATKEMLTSPVCQKLVTYFFNKYPEVVEEMKQNQDNEEFLKNIENISKGNGNLIGLDIYAINNFLLKFLLKDSLNKGKDLDQILYSKARAAGCTELEVTKAKELMDAVIQPFVELIDTDETENTEAKKEKEKDKEKNPSLKN